MLAIIAGPFPFGAVQPSGRLALELLALGLMAVWVARAPFRATPLPPRLGQIGVAGLLLLCALQALPLGRTIVGAISPQAVSIRADSLPADEAREAERNLLGLDSARLDPPVSPSLDPGASASALRTGAALAALFYVATTVVAICGARRIALALLASAVFQGLYGLLVVASGHDRIWNVPKLHFLDKATGTFVNPNHFAALLGMALPAGFALLYDHARRHRRKRGGRLVHWFSADGSRNLLLALFLIVGSAGLVLSQSRAGIALGLLGIGLTLMVAGRDQRLPLRVIVTVLVVGAAVTPLARVGAESLIQRYADSPNEMEGARVQVWIDSVSLVKAYPVVGCGFGAFSASYPLVRSPEIRRFFSQTHNDALQVLVEGGLVGLLLLVMLSIPVVDRIVRSLGGADGPLAVGLAAGLVVVLLKSSVDFPFHMPSLAAIAVILAGSLLGLPWKTVS